jgi:excisionase family DNA binding protein
VTTTPPSDQADPALLLDYQELASWLHDSVRHLRRLVNENRIPFVKIGHYIRFDREQVRCWLQDNAHPATGHQRAS